MEFVVKPKPKFKVTIGEQSFMVSRPSLEQIEEMEDREANQKGGAKALRELLAQLGLPSEVTKPLDMESIGELVEYIVGKKKVE